MREPMGIRARCNEVATEISGTGRWQAIIWSLFGGGAVTVGLFAILQPHDVRRSYNPAGVAVGLALVVALSGVGIVRGWRMGLRLAYDGVTVRNFFRTYRLAWHEVSGFVDGAVVRLNEGPERQWRLSIALRGGRAIVASATSWSAKTKAALEEAAQRYGIPIELTGVITSRKSAASLGSEGGDCAHDLVIEMIADAPTREERQKRAFTCGAWNAWICGRPLLSVCRR